MTIYEQIKELLNDKKGCIVTSTEVKRELKAKYCTNTRSILLSDYCYNRTNDGIRFDKHIFEYICRNTYKYLGEDFPFTGKIYHKPIKQKVKEFGEWINGRMIRYQTEK